MAAFPSAQSKTKVGRQTFDQRRHSFSNFSLRDNKKKGGGTSNNPRGIGTLQWHWHTHSKSKPMQFIHSFFNFSPFRIFFPSHFHVKMQSMHLLHKLSAYSNGTRRMGTNKGGKENGSTDQTDQTDELKANGVSDQTEELKANGVSDQTDELKANGVSDQTEELKENGAGDQSDANQTELVADEIPIEVHVYSGTALQKREDEIQEEDTNDEKNEEGEEEKEEERGKMEEGEEEEEEEEEPTPAQLARWRRRRLLPNEVVNDICDFMSFAEGNRLYTLNGLFVALLEPKRKLCLAVFLKRVEDTRQKLDQTIQATLKEVNERRRHVVQLTEHIGTINARLAEMGDHLANLDAQIVVNHGKLDELQRRIGAMKEPMANLKKGKSDQ